MNCKICSNNAKLYFNELVLNKYKVDYFRCGHCGFIFTEEPYWLDEAYKLPINISDTGLLFRNMYLAKMTACLFYLSFNKDGKYLDYAGGYGVYTRLMRDIGFDFYWNDPFCKNLFATGFAAAEPLQKIYQAVTTFESFEHFVSPKEELEKLLAVSDTVVFSTNLHNFLQPVEKEWWYFSFGHGQHISLYTKESLSVLAEQYNKRFYTFGDLHIFTGKEIPALKMYLIKRTGKHILYEYVRHKMQGKTMEDHYYMKTFENR
ncbi:MAG: class I SAM-dependent methyltransferase [Ignavibacteriales bacterium]|nr:class I SAM-dependent methyltransferase [Ignavibacteriales bacterium]